MSHRLKRLRRRIARIPYQLDRAKWWVLHRFHPKHRYHVIRTGLKPGWCDRADLMPVLMVKMLVDFVEKEKPFDTVNSRQAEKWVRLRELYEFFKDIDPEDIDDMDEDVLAGKLVELVHLRGLMWT